MPYVKNIDNVVNTISRGKNNISNYKKNINKLDDINILISDNFSLEYYSNIFMKEDIYKQKINKIVFKYMTCINVLLFIFLILFTSIMLKLNIITYSNIIHVIFENCITFFFVCIIEILFFVKIASKFIPSPPSAIFSFLLSNLQQSI